MKVHRLPKDPGPAAWNDLLPAPAPAEPLDSHITAEWLVIGAGFAGLAAARRLSQNCPGERIIVLDAVRVGEGPAGRNSGFMIDLPHDLSSENYGGEAEKDHQLIRANRAAISFALDTAKDYGLPEEAIVQSGKINAAATEAGMRHNVDFGGHVQALGEPCTFMDAADMQRLTGIDYYLGGLYTPGAAMIQPAMFVRSVADGLRSNRVTIHEQSPVKALEREGGHWRAITPGGSVTAPKVILAVNGHVESFGFFERRLMHTFTYASMTRALTSSEVNVLGGEPVWGLTPSGPMGSTVRRISGVGGDRIIVRNRFTYDPSMEISGARIAAVARDHYKAFAARFPMLKGVEMQYRWGGRLCVSRNDAPAFGEVDEHLYSACCQNGLGTARGTFSGVAVADLACGLETEFSQYQAQQPEPVKLPPQPFAWLGINGYMRWQEMKSGREM